jgi:cell fate (sporulation/competence/biofilm development) regulator YmcA (YheA/YmcA/DUF963 family)
MKYKQLVIQRLEQLENQIKVLQNGRNFPNAEALRNHEQAISENIEQIKTFVNQNQEE